MVDVRDVAELLTAHALRQHAHEVDLIAMYGSRARGDTREDSDLDIFYTPADGTHPPVGRTFLLEGRLFDFWRLTWDTLEGFATGRIRGWAFAPAVVHHAKILHARSPEQAARLESLKMQILDLQTPESRPQMLKRSLDRFSQVLAHLGNLRLAVPGGQLGEVRHSAWKLVAAVWECLALANQVFFDRGMSNALSELPKLEHRPPDVRKLISEISESSSSERILAASEQLALSTRRTLRRLQDSAAARLTVGVVFREAYPEMKDLIVKLLAACERGDRVAAGIWSMYLQTDVTMMLDRVRQGIGHGEFNLYGELAAEYRAVGFPDLIASSAGPLVALADQAKLFDNRLRTWLDEQAVDLVEFENLDELSEALQV